MGSRGGHAPTREGRHAIKDKPSFMIFPWLRGPSGRGSIVADAKKNAEVASIASVSGGSLTNGYLAQAVDFRSTTGEELREAADPSPADSPGPGRSSPPRPSPGPTSSCWG